jgi:hypothetical protein
MDEALEVNCHGLFQDSVRGCHVETEGTQEDS